MKARFYRTLLIRLVLLVGIHVNRFLGGPGFNGLRALFFSTGIEHRFFKKVAHLFRCGNQLLDLINHGLVTMTFPKQKGATFIEISNLTGLLKEFSWL